MSQPLHLYDSDALFLEFQRDIAVSADRLEANGQMPCAVAIREDLWPPITAYLGYPVARLAASSPVMWGVLV